MNKLKYIHQTWFQGETECPKKFTPLRKRWKELHPTLEYKFWDEQNLDTFIQEHYPEFYEEWKNLDVMIKKCDASRYMFMHHYGGVYADEDTYPVKNVLSIYEDLEIDPDCAIFATETKDLKDWKTQAIKDLLSTYNANDFFEENIAPVGNIDYVVGNAILISPPGNQVFYDFLVEAFKVKEKPILESFATWHLTEFLSKNSHKYNASVIPYRYLLSNTELDESYTVHLYDGGWLDWSKEIPWMV